MTELSRTVVLALAAALILALVAITVLAIRVTPVPDVLIVVVSTTLGLLGGMLAPRPDLSVTKRPED